MPCALLVLFLVNNMRVLITGATGFIGSALAAYFLAHGHAVVGTTTKDMQNENAFPLKKICLDDAWPNDFFEGFDAVIHCAYAIDKTAEYNVRAIQKIAEQAQGLGITNQLFISSYSARSDAVSQYGMGKFALEKYFLDSKATVVRPGLVVGDGGLFLAQVKTVLQIPVLFLPHKGKIPVPLITIQDLCKALYFLCINNKKGAYNLFFEPLPTQEDLVKKIWALHAKKEKKIFGIAPMFFIGVNKALRFLGCSVPTLFERVETAHMDYKNTIHTSDLDALGITHASLEDLDGLIKNILI